MWMMRARIVILIASFMMMGCNQDISGVRIDMEPNQGCAPLNVALTGKATVRDGVDVQYRWTVNGEALQPGNKRVQYAFSNPGAYDIAFTVASGKQQKTQTAVFDVSEAKVPDTPGVYRRQACAYESLPQVTEETQAKSLGKTTLEDLRKYIVAEKQSTPELMRHPLWRQDRTHTTHTIERSQFVDVPLDHFQRFGFITIGKALGEATLHKVVQSPEPGETGNVLTRMIDSWGKESVAPPPQALQRTELAPEIVHYLPSTELTAGLYVISLPKEDGELPVMSPVALGIASR